MHVRETYLHVFESVAPKFLAKLKERVLGITVSNGMKLDTTIEQVHSKSQRSKVELPGQ